MERPHYLEALRQADILRKLAAFSPHVVGTPPLGLDLSTSDIDVICFAPERNVFAGAVWDAFGTCPGFRMWRWIGRDRPVIATFACAGWVIEVFGQAIPISGQYGWRHFEVEQRLLAQGSAAFRSAVLARRGNGAKTEPAFAEVLGLDGDPYDALLDLECRSDEDLIALLRDKGFG